jgi:XTP/dITP diphosphohydrolase
MNRLLVATRSSHKLREIAEILGELPDLRLLDLTQAGISRSPREDEIECFDTFEENALAKARFFASRSGMPVLADDSGLCVDALGGAPGVRSKRFSGRSDLAGQPLDDANNERLLSELEGVPPQRRSARFVCALALVAPPSTEHVFRGTVQGFILDQLRGEHGFGYDPLFFLPSLGASLAELPPSEKNRISHRASAVRAARPTLESLRSAPS